MLSKRFIIISIVFNLFFVTKSLFIEKQEQIFSDTRVVFAESVDIKVWFEGNTKRVKQKELAKDSCYIWDGKKVYINAARNEYEPFQLILRSEHDVSNINICISDLVSGDNIISRDNFKLYKVHYVSAKRHGMIADPLIPLRGSVDLSAGINQPVWIRLYIPSDVVSGVYSGAITVGMDEVGKVIPIELRVWDFILPEASTLFRVSPHWESSSFVKETYGKPANYIDLVYSFYRELKRMGISPAQSFDLKKVGTEGFSESEGGIAIDFSKTDHHIDYVLNELKYNNLEAEFFYSPVGKYDPNRSYPFNPTYIKRVTQYLSLISNHYRDKGWLSRMWVQHYGDEPCQTCEGGEHSHPSYEAIRDWSKLFHSATPDLKILLAEHPTPQLIGAVDIWNASWHLLKRGDVRERHKAGEKVIAYSCDSKLRDPLITERINLWNIFSEEADGCWSWHLYSMGNFTTDDASRRYSVFYNGKTVGITDEPVISLRSEMMGEGKDDWEYLKLIEESFGKDMAISIANIVAKRPGPLGRRNVDEEGIYKVRDFLGRKLESKSPKFQDNFVDLNWISEMENIKTDLMYDGFVKLDYAEAPVLIEGFENLTQWKTRGPVKATLNYDRKTEGNSSVKVVFNKGETDPMLFSFSSTRLSVTDWRDYGFLEFDVYTEPDLSLFDVSITFNNEYGRGYNVRGGVDWNKGDQVHAIGIYSQNGSFPGKWRHVKIDFDNISGKLSTLSGRRNVTSLHFRMGRGGTVNEPLPNTDYIIYIDNITLQKKRYKTYGKIISKPIFIGVKTDGFEWIGDYSLPYGTELQFESRTGSTYLYDPKTWEDWKPIDITSFLKGKLSSTPNNYIQYKVIFTSDGYKTPKLRGVTIY
ncbi:MAG: glycoside hydrolase domain-containing protein [Candidatus Scalinduaceae bacterium]